MPEYPEIEALVVKTVGLLAEDFEIEALQNPTADSALYGSNGPLDSMGLVNLIADLEDAISEQFDISITLADEKAMSAYKSPFSDIKSLANAILERVRV
ncbi:MAG: hypothetical protein AAGH40_01265 [Verrucomicrobiota bacterium]